MNYRSLNHFFDHQIEAIDCNSFRLNWNDLGWIACMSFWNVEKQDMDTLTGQGGSPKEAISDLLIQAVKLRRLGRRYKACLSSSDALLEPLDKDDPLI